MSKAALSTIGGSPPFFGGVAEGRGAGGGGGGAGGQGCGPAGGGWGGWVVADAVFFENFFLYFHIFVRLDPKETEHLDDAGLVGRFRALYGSKKCASLGLDADDLEVILKNNRDPPPRVSAAA